MAEPQTLGEVMIPGLVFLAVGAVLGPIAWRYSGSPKRTTRWVVAAFLGISTIVPMRLIQVRWPEDSGENFGALMVFIFGMPLAAATTTMLVVCAIRSVQRKNMVVAIVAGIGVLLCATLIVPPFLR